MKQQMTAHQMNQQRAKSPIHSVPVMVGHQTPIPNEQMVVNGQPMPYQTSQPIMPSMSMQLQAHSVPQQSIPGAPQVASSQNAYPYPNQGPMHSHSVPMAVSTAGPQQRAQSPQQPSPQNMPSSQVPPQVMPSAQPPPQQSQQRLSHEQFRAALQLVVSPGDPRFLLTDHLFDY